MCTANSTPLAEGKTKIITSLEVAKITSKNDLTAGNGAKHDVLAGKAELANRTTSNVFKLLQHFRIPVAFYGVYGPDSFLAPLCRMQPWEVVVRAEAHGSYLKRNPELAKGQSLGEEPICEFFLKTSGKKLGVHDLPCDDPYALIDFKNEMVELFHPDQPVVEGHGFRLLPLADLYIDADDIVTLPRMAEIAIQAFLILQAAWKVAGYRLVDMKVEFGISHSGDDLLLADVIDNDSWRLIPEGEDVYVDKQAYRDGGTLDDVLDKYHRVADASNQFARDYYRIEQEVAGVFDEG